LGNAVKIRTLSFPEPPLSSFDPGAYLSGLEFYETDGSITEEERDGLAQFAHFLAFLALHSKSTKWDRSVVQRRSLAYRALESHFGHLDGWPAVAADGAGMSYRELTGFLMQHYPPHPPEADPAAAPDPAT
jgi:hypothetical protein